MCSVFPQSKKGSGTLWLILNLSMHVNHLNISLNVYETQTSPCLCWWPIVRSLRVLENSLILFWKYLFSFWISMPLSHSRKLWDSKLHRTRAIHHKLTHKPKKVWYWQQLAIMRWKQSLQNQARAGAEDTPGCTNKCPLLLHNHHPLTPTSSVMAARGSICIPYVVPSLLSPTVCSGLQDHRGHPEGASREMFSVGREPSSVSGYILPRASERASEREKISTCSQALANGVACIVTDFKEN